MMNPRHKSQIDSGHNLKSGEEQRRLLCRNNASIRCSSFDFNNSHFVRQNDWPESPDQLNEEQNEKLQVLLERMAEVIFNAWLEEINHNK